MMKPIRKYRPKAIEVKRDVPDTSNISSNLKVSSKQTDDSQHKEASIKYGTNVSVLRYYTQRLKSGHVACIKKVA